MSTITKEQAQKIIEAADEVITALAGTNEDVHPESDSMLRLWDDLNDRYAPPEVVRELARIAMASLEADGALANEGAITATQFKPVADLYEVTVPSGRSTTFTKDAAEASDCRVMGWPVQEYVKLERYQAAMLQGADGNSPMIPDGLVLVPVEPTYQMCEAMGLPWESPRFPDRYKAMIAAAPDFREIGNSSTNNFRENAETSTKCPCCGRKPLKNKTCSVAGCDGKHVARGFCAMHYAIERKKDPSRRESIRAADKRYRARKAAAPQQEVKNG